MTKVLGLFGSLAVASALAAIVWPDSQVRPPHEDHNSGAYLYRAYCGSCHGPDGRGDGPVADLTRPRPADLTRLASQHDGVFPRADVRELLAGRRLVTGHDTAVMPNWREVIRRVQHGDDRAADAAIDALVLHLETLQK